METDDVLPLGQVREVVREGCAVEEDVWTAALAAVGAPVGLAGPAGAAGFKNEQDWDEDQDDQGVDGDPTNDGLLPEEHDLKICGCNACVWEKALFAGEFEAAIDVYECEEDI